MSSKEFIRWGIYLEKKVHRTTPDQYYLAQIAQEIRRTVVKKPRGVKLKWFLLKFMGQKKYKEPQTVEEASKRSKSFWLGLVSQGKEPPPKKKD